MSAGPVTPPAILVLAGTNGAGKSSIAGAAIRDRGAYYFNPDEAARRYRDAGVPLSEANSRAWADGKRLLERAIASRLAFTFETTLGGNTIPALLERAVANGLVVRVWFVGLEGVELHLARIRARVAAGGHDIPEAMVRQRYDRSRENLVRLLPAVAELRLFDNSAPPDPATGRPRPRLILSMKDGRIEEMEAIADVPGWAKPVVMAAIRIHAGGGEQR